jgi:type III pantothenate kinase
MQLLVDMGNTRLKWATVENQRLLVGIPLLNDELNEQTLLKLWQALFPPQQLVIACVTANQRLDWVITVAMRLWTNIKVVQVRSQTQGFGVTNAYTQPEKLGVDRWLALIAARQSYTVPVCIIDCGTAITIDLLDANGQHLGGFISAGLTLMKQSLAQGTNALPLAMNAYSLAPAHHTEAAIYNGTLLAAVGLIEQVLARQTTPFSVLLTGGDAPFIALHLNGESMLDMDLVLRGLAIVAEG